MLTLEAQSPLGHGMILSEVFSICTMFLQLLVHQIDLTTGVAVTKHYQKCKNSREPGTWGHNYVNKNLNHQSHMMAWIFGYRKKCWLGGLILTSLAFFAPISGMELARLVASMALFEESWGHRFDLWPVLTDSLSLDKHHLSI